MRPDDSRWTGDQANEAAAPMLDADLVGIDEGLRAAGRQATLALRTRTQPTRWYSIELRSRLRERLSPRALE